MQHIIIASIATTLVAALSTAATAQPSMSAQQSTSSTIRACSTPNTSASIAIPAPPEFPEIAAQQHVTGVSTVRVDLDATGNVMSSSVFASSGNRWLDNAALVSARTSRYVAERRNCDSVAGSYAVNVEFPDPE